MRLLALLLFASSLLAQKRSPEFHPSPPMWTSNDPHGIWEVPRTEWESVRESLFGHITWKHYRVEWIPLKGHIAYCKVENMTHHLPYYFDHDPRNLNYGLNFIEFDAPAGDMIAWKVWSR